MKITYTKVGDYLIPDLTLPPETDERTIGVWGMRHKRYLTEHKKANFTIMQKNGTLFLIRFNFDFSAFFALRAEETAVICSE